MRRFWSNLHQVHKKPEVQRDKFGTYETFLEQSSSCSQKTEVQRDKFGTYETFLEQSSSGSQKNRSSERQIWDI